MGTYRAKFESSWLSNQSDNRKINSGNEIAVLRIPLLDQRILDIHSRYCRSLELKESKREHPNIQKKIDVRHVCLNYLRRKVIRE